MSNQTFYIALLQDDHFQLSDSVQAITKALNKVEFEKISCEAEFLDCYEQRPNKMPDVFVLDLMVEWQSRWVKTNRVHNPKLETDQAGMRCLEAIRKYDGNVPIIICTVIDTDTLDQNLFDEKINFLRRKDQGVDRLIELIKKLLVA